MLKSPNYTAQPVNRIYTGGYRKGYQHEGTGRDTYIATNNGGFTVSHKVTPQLHPGTIYYPEHDVLMKMASGKRNSSQVQAVSAAKTANVCPIKYTTNGTGRDTYIFSNNGGFCIQEGSRPFCGLQKSFVNSLRAYAHPATRPVTAVRGRRYTLANGNRFEINCSAATQHAAKRGFTVSRTQKDKLNNFLVKRRQTIDTSSLAHDVTALQIQGKTAKTTKARSRPVSPINEKVDVLEKAETKSQALTQAQSSPNLNAFGRRSKSVGRPEHTTEQLLNPVEKLEVAPEKPRPKTGCHPRAQFRTMTPANLKNQDISVWHDLVTEKALEQKATRGEVTLGQQTVSHQRFTSARLSVPHERRKREKFVYQKKLQGQQPTTPQERRRVPSSDGTSAMEKMNALRAEKANLLIEDQSAENINKAAPASATMSTGFAVRRRSQPRQDVQAQLRGTLRRLHQQHKQKD